MTVKSYQLDKFC